MEKYIFDTSYKIDLEQDIGIMGESTVENKRC